MIQSNIEVMKNWNVKLTAGGKTSPAVEFHWYIFQGDALLPLLFVIAMKPLNHILKKCTSSNKLTKSQEKINHLMYIDDIKLFTKKSEKEVETLIHAIRANSQKIEKCAMLIMRSRKRQMTEGIELPNQERIRTLEEKETYKYLDILEVVIY